MEAKPKGIEDVDGSALYNVTSRGLGEIEDLSGRDDGHATHRG